MRMPSHLAALLAIAMVWLASGVLQAQAQEEWSQQRAEPRSLLSDFYSQADRGTLKQSLRLSAEQDKLWSPVDDALNKLAEQRQAFRSALSQEPTDQFERLRRRAELTSQRADALKKLADAVQPLWSSLSDEQKRELARALPGSLQLAYQSSRRDDRRDADDLGPYRRNRDGRHYDEDRSRDREDYRGWRDRRSMMDRRRGDMMDRRRGDELDDDRDEDRFDRYARRRGHDEYSPRARRHDDDYYDRRSGREYCRCYRHD